MPSRQSCALQRSWLSCPCCAQWTLPLHWDLSPKWGCQAAPMTWRKKLSRSLSIAMRTQRCKEKEIAVFAPKLWPFPPSSVFLFQKLCQCVSQQGSLEKHVLPPQLDVIAERKIYWAQVRDLPHIWMQEDEPDFTTDLYLPKNYRWRPRKWIF